MNRKFIRWSLLLIVTVFNIYYASNLTQSRAKYIKTDEIKSGATIRKMSLSESEYNQSDSHDIILVTNASTYDKAVFNITFNKNNVMYEDVIHSNGIDKSDHSDNYTVNLKYTDKCSIITSSISMNGTLNSSSSGSFNVSYSSNDSDAISFTVKCDVVDNELIDNSEDVIKLGFTVTEQLTNYEDTLEQSFTYLDTTSLVTLNDYYVGNRIPPVEEDNYYEAAIEVLNNTYASYDENTVNKLITYFNTVFPKSVDNDTFENNIKNLPGFSATIGETNTYTFDDSFLGYALTYYSNTNSSSDNTRYFIFSNNTSLSTKTEREDLFSYYIDTYGTTIMKNNKTLITNYINTYTNGVDDMINNNILGITSSDMNIDDHTRGITITDNLVTYINNYNNPVRISNNTLSRSDMFNNQFATGLVNYTVVGNANYSKIINDMGMFSALLVTPSELYTSIVRNSLDEIDIRTQANGTTEDDEVIQFSDFYIVDGGAGNGARKAMVNVYSDKDSTYVKIYYLSPGTTIKLARPVNSTISNKSFVDIINEIDSIMNPTIHTDITNISELTSVYGVTYSTETIDEPSISGDSIEYITYTLR